MRPRSLLMGLIVLVVLLASGAAALSAGGVHWPAWVIAAVAAAVTAVASVIKPIVDALTKARVDRIESDGASEKRLSDVLESATGSRSGLPLLKDIRARSILGVHPAIPLPVDADQSLSSEFPTYVPRDSDAGIRTHLTRMAVTGGFLLLVGEPAAGKTRCAVEAVQALPDNWKIYIRSGNTTLQELVGAGVPLVHTVVWLDDIHQLLDSDTTDPNHLTAALVRRLLLPTAGPVIIIATTWPDRRDLYNRQPIEGSPDLMADARAVLQMAQQIDLTIAFSDEEWTRALSLSMADPRLKEAVAANNSRALAATLACREELIRRWRSTSKSMVSTVISAAIDARRCGCPEPISEKIIEALTPHYMSPSQRARVSSGWLESAIGEACEPIRGDTRPMQPVAAFVAGMDGYEVSDILLEYARNSQNVAPVPRAVWETIITTLTDPSVLYLIGAAAYYAGETEIAELGFQLAADGGNASAINGLGFLMYYAEDHKGAELHFRRAAELGHPAALNNLGGLLASRGYFREAEEYYQQAINAGHMSALTNLGFLLEGKGRLAQAERYYRRAADAGIPEALNNLGALLASRDESDEAETYYRRAADAGSIDALNNLGILLAGQGDSAEAEKYYREAISRGNIDALNNLGVLLADQGKLTEAENYYRQAIDAGSIDASNGLGNLLASRGEIQEADLFYRRAAEAGNKDALNSLGVLLAGRGEVDEAERHYRRAADAGSADALNNLGALLADRDNDPATAEEYYLRAINVGSADALCGMGVLLAGIDGSEEASRYYRRSTDSEYASILNDLATRIHKRSFTTDQNLGSDLAGDRSEHNAHIDAWFEAAAVAGSTRAMTLMAARAMKEGDKEAARDWYEQAANMGDTRGMVRLARLLGPKHGFKVLVQAVRTWRSTVPGS
jgi:TPR repeat protein